MATYPRTLAQAATTDLPGTYAQLPATADQIIFVSPRGSDSNSGLSLKTAKLTLGAAVTAIGTGGGLIKLAAGTITCSSQVTFTGASNGDSFGNRGLTIQGCGPGVTVLDFSGAGGITALHRSSNGGMFVNLEDLEIKGPGKAVASSRGVYWENTGGNTLWKNVYVHGFETGIEWYDATLHTLVNVAVRNCALGIKTGFNQDILNISGCRIDYNDLGIQIGTAATSASDCIRFTGCRISNNTQAWFLNDTNSAGIRFDSCYFETNAKDGVIGVLGRDDGSARPNISFTDCFWQQTSGPVAEGISVYSCNPLITVSGCRTDANAFTTFLKFYASYVATSPRFEAWENYFLSRVVSYDGRDYTVPNGRLSIGVGNNHEGNGAYLPAGPWHLKRMANGTGMSWESWRRVASNDLTNILGEIGVQDVGGVLRLEGLKAGGVCATNAASLPAASVNYRGMLYRVDGGAGVADLFYVCQKSAGDTYSWKLLSTG